MECDLGFIIAVVGTGMAFMAAMIAMFLWNRAESRTDRLDLQNEIRMTRDVIQAEMKDFHDQMKGFHGRLCTLEERFINFLIKRDEKT